MEQIYTQIRRYIDEQRQPMLNLWRNLVNTESGTTQIDGVNAVCSILRREMENAGIHTRVRAIQNSGDMLIGEWNPKRLCCSSATWTPCSRRARRRKIRSA